MSDDVKAVPDGRDGIAPYLAVKNCAEAIEFYKKAFGAEEVFRIGMPGGGVGHAELMIGPALIMLSDEYPEMDVRGPESLGGSPVTLSMYVEDVDGFVARAVTAGATVVRAVEDQFYGDRSCKLVDPYGHVWSFASRIEDVSSEEMKRRAAELYGA